MRYNFILSIIFAGSLQAQTTISREFIYAGKPVSPAALVYMFPNMQDGTAIDTIDLKKYPFSSAAKKDTLDFKWAKAYQKDRAYSEWARYSSLKRYDSKDTAEIKNMSGNISYIMLGNTANGKFIVLATFNSGSTLDQACIFILDIRGDKLIRVKSFLESSKAFTHTIEIKGDTILNGPNRYIIPAYAR